MAWEISQTGSLLTGMACNMYNTTSSSELPGSAGPWGIDFGIWGQLIALTKRKYLAQGMQLPPDTLKGLCIYASAVAAKYYVHRFGYINSQVVHVTGPADHYFVVVRASGDKALGICDITCDQFDVAPHFIVGSLKDVKGKAKKVAVKGFSLYEAYALGMESKTFVM